MTLCFLSVCQFNEFAGGLDRVCCLLSREFIRRGYRLIYVFGIPSKLRHPADGCEGDGQYQFPYSIWDDRNITFFSELVKSQKVDIVIDAAFISRYHDVAYQARKASSFKLITTNHGDPLCDLKELRDRVECLPLNYGGFSLIRQRIYAKLKYPLALWVRYKSLKSRFTKIVKESDAYVVLCEDYAKQVRAITRAKNAAHIVAISNPIDLLRLETVMPAKKNQVLFVGRLNEQKRVDRLLRVWAKVENRLNGWELVIVGDGDARSKYEKFARRLRLTTVRFVGNVNSSEEMMRSTIVVMVSSHEGFGMTLIEGMAVGTVPVAFDSYKALGDIIDDGVNGFRIKTWNCTDFADKIVELATDNSLWKSLSANAKEKVQKFDVHRIADRWECLFKETTAS